MTAEGDSDRARFLADVVAGLGQPQKQIPCRWLYDETGSELFEQITRLEEYYPTRVETGIIGDNLAAIAGFLGRGAIIEYGAGSCRKTEPIIAAARPVRYLPIDISAEMLETQARHLRQLFPAVRIEPIVGDFTDPALLLPPGDATRSVFFPGSTIGNFTDPQIDALLAGMSRMVGPGGRAVVGMDLRKPLPVLLAAYDDRDGVTAAFNRNLLVRANRELGADFDLSAFRHEARWNERDSAIEMHLVSTVAQVATIGEARFHFAAGETIHTESSRKFTLAGFEVSAARNGWTLQQVWRDAQSWFAVVGIAANPG